MSLEESSESSESSVDPRELARRLGELKDREPTDTEVKHKLESYYRRQKREAEQAKAKKEARAKRIREEKAREKIRRREYEVALREERERRRRQLNR